MSRSGQCFPERIAEVDSFESLLGYLRDDLDWDIESVDRDEISFDWQTEDLRIGEDAGARVKDGVVHQLRPVVTGQPWGIFLVEFTDGHVYRTALREVLRGLVPRRRRDPHLPAWQHEDLLFLCTTAEYDRFTFVHFRGEKMQKAKLAAFGWERGSPYVRTLCEFNLPQLRWPEDPADPDAWRAQWRSAFDKEPLTRRFYREIANWYFWAREHARFPKDAPLDADGKPSLMLIRLLTRLVFCWFLKQKTNPQTGQGLLHSALFDPECIAELLKRPGAESCTYYTGILQNLFFATLNTKMDAAGMEGRVPPRPNPAQPLDGVEAVPPESSGKPMEGRVPPRPNRRFIDEGDGRHSDDHMVHQRWRNAGQLRDPERLADLLRGIPFLNGGLFECLDDRVTRDGGPGTAERRVDGFSSDPRKQPKLPNFLFYGPDQTVNLSAVYGDGSHVHESVSPLLSILHRYNFTLSEDTPLDQEVALDPELLGHVFENLLAAYNPETGKAARKATGSFYTPRVVVDWMTDQALVHYFADALGGTASTPSQIGPVPVGVAPDPPRPGSGGSASTPSTSTPSGPCGTGPSTDPGARLRRLLSWEDDTHDFQPRDVSKLVNAIDRLKILDPACGSGAFLIGVLQKLVCVLQKLDPANNKWRERQEKAVEAMESSTARQESLKAIARAFARDNDNYGRKLYLIENCLYGVDIQPIAVQIAKLRFFVSLIVDQTIDPVEENYGILPLPNLETKIVAANTLLGLQRGQLLLGSDEVRRLERELQQLRHDYFTARSYRRKKELRARDRELSAELAVALTNSGECSAYDAQRLAGWNPYDTNAEAPFFDPGWMFGLRSGGTGSTPSVSGPSGPGGTGPSMHADSRSGGTGSTPSASTPSPAGVEPGPPGAGGGPFDIVIGNPPYVRQEDLKNIVVTGSDGKPRPLKQALKGQYECYAGTADLYVYFFERSLQLLRTGGILSFITSNKYFRAAYGESLRTYLRWATRPTVLLDFGDTDVFTSIAYPAILVARKARNVEHGQLPSTAGVLRPGNLPPEDWQARVMTWTPGADVGGFPSTFDRDAFSLQQRELKPDGWRLESPAVLRLMEKLRKAGQPLGEFVGVRVFRGITTGLNEAFVVDGPTRDRLVAEHASSAYIIKRYLRGRDVKRWVSKSDDLWIIFTRRGCNIEDYPAVHEHLKQFKRRLLPGEPGGRKPGVYQWYEIQDNIAYWREFERPKVVSTKISIRPTFAVDAEQYFLGNTSYFIPTGEQTLYVCGLLNSALFFAYAKRVFVEKQGGWYEVQPQGLEAFPITPAAPVERAAIAALVERILAAKSDDAAADVSDLERQIDDRVYRLYGLTRDEIRIVEDAK